MNSDAANTTPRSPPRQDISASAGLTLLLILG
jgi:hypothetical protein